MLIICFNKISIYGEEASKVGTELKSEDTCFFDFNGVIRRHDYDKVEVKSTFPN